MKKLLLAGAAALAVLTATPALAQTNAGFTGTRVELQTGINKSNIAKRDITYGGVLGYDVAVSDRVTIGVDVDATNIFDRNGRILGAGARAGLALNPNAQLFGRIGYANRDGRFRTLHGATAGGGFQFRINRNAYINTEYRYTNYAQGVHSNAGLLGIGFRF